MLLRYPLAAACLFAVSVISPTFAAADGSRAHHSQTLVIDRERILQMPARNLADVIDTVAGVQIQRLYGLGDSYTYANQYGVGGASFQQPLVLLNGRRMDFAQGGARGLNGIPLDSVERIEVLPFTGAALYGQGASGAVVNVITRQAIEDAAEMTLEGGSYNTRKGSIWASTRRGNTRLLSAAEINASDGYRKHNDLRQHNGYIDLRHQLSASTLYLTFQGSSEEMDTLDALPTSINNPKASVGTPVENKRDTYHLMPGVVWHFEQMDAYLEGSMFGHGMERQDIHNGIYQELDVTGYSVTPRLAGQAQTGALNHHWTVGWDLYEVRYKDKSTALVARAEHNQSGVYGQLSTEFTPWFATTLAARHETVRQQDWLNHKRDKQDLAQYEGSLKFQLAEPLSLVFSAARTEQVLDVFQNYHQSVAPETGQLYSGTLAWSDNGQSSALSYWYGTRDNQFLYDTTNNQFNNLADKTSHSGFSLNSRWRLDKNVWLTLNGTVQKNTFKEGQYKGSRVPQTPRRTGYVQFDWRALQWLDLTVAQRYHGARFYMNDMGQQLASQRGYNWTDMAATAYWQKFSVTVGVYNLQDRKAYDVGFVDSNNDTHRYPLPGRHVMASISAKL